MIWQKVSPPLWWPKARRYVVGDSVADDGTRLHLVEGSAEPGLVISNARIYGLTEHPNAVFSPTPSHLSE